MDARNVVSSVIEAQHAFNFLSGIIHISSYLWQPPEPNVKDNAEYDYIVVGGGTAGCVIASRLAEDENLRILLIEAGGDPDLASILPAYLVYLKDSHSVYNFTTTSDGTQQCSRKKEFVYNMGRMLGGTSGVNFLSYERGNKHDFDRWADIAQDPTWTYPYILDYLKKSEHLKEDSIKDSDQGHYHGYDGPLDVTSEGSPEVEEFLEAFRELGNDIVVDLNGDITTGYSRGLLTVDKDGKQSTAHAFLNKPINNLDILKYTEVQKILIDDNNVAIGVEAVRSNKKLTLYAKNEVILSAGVINTPKILMLSGIGPKKHLEDVGIPVISDLPVGENFHDHMSVIVNIKLGEYNKPARPRDSYKFPFPYFLGYVTLDDIRNNNYPEYTVSNYVLNDEEMLKICAFLYNHDFDLCNKIYSNVKGRKILHTVLRKSQPKSRGKILLRSSKPNDQPIVDTGILSNKTDIVDNIRYLKHFLQILNTVYFKQQGAEVIDPLLKTCDDDDDDDPLEDYKRFRRYLVEEDITKIIEQDIGAIGVLKSKCGDHAFGSDGYWRCYLPCMVIPSGHAVGTCALGTVVDPRLNVRGIQHLRVADASIIPIITSSGTCATTVMIGEKAAQMIKEDLVQSFYDYDYPGYQNNY